MKSEAKFIDQEQRDRAAQDISESYIIEAAAGTGKTTVLVTRIINLIKEGEARLEEIVAITFTEKAAAELKVKLRQEMERVAQADPSSDENSRISEAISDLERMQVTTIHSFCGSLLRERPVEAGLDPNFEVADDLTSSLVQAEVWEGGWKSRWMQTTPPCAVPCSLELPRNRYARSANSCWETMMCCSTCHLLLPLKKWKKPLGNSSRPLRKM